MQVAVLYETTPQGKSVEVGQIRVVDERLVGRPATNPAVEFVLSRAARRPDGMLVTTETPHEFLAALPSAYSGSMLRVALETR